MKKAEKNLLRQQVEEERQRMVQGDIQVVYFMIYKGPMYLTMI
jgi:hypothetical protein